MKAKLVAVYDANETDLAVTAAAVREYFDRWGNRDGPAEIRRFSDGYALSLDFKKNRYAMAFIGVSGMADMELVRDIRSGGGDIPVFLVSGRLDYGAEGIRLRVRDYLMKPVIPERVKEAMKN